MERYFPYGLRPARVEERRQFYESEFNFKQAMRWLQLSEDSLADLYVDVGTETTRYRPMFSHYLDKLVHIKYKGEDGLKRKLIKYRPEDVYYQRTYAATEADKKEELAFDLDPRGLTGGCHRCKTRAEMLNGNKRLKTLTFCKECFKEVTQHCLKLYQFLDRHFQQVTAVFSGRGYHLHVRDREGFELNERDRKELAKRLVKEYPIDPQVTAGDKDLMRLPGSLNGTVGRKAVTVSQQELQDAEQVIRKSEPLFLAR